jgi:endonuclease YncB( thermonuclease family)
MVLVATSFAQTITGKVVRVADGDTVTVLDASNTQHRIRLSGIDAPEKNQAFGNRSKESLSALLAGKTVTVETNKLDKYGRSLGKVMVDGTDANLEQIKLGMAWHYKAYMRDQPAIDRKIYAEAEVEAKAAKRGLWSDAAPIAPWEFRQQQRN